MRGPGPAEDRELTERGQHGVEAKNTNGESSACGARGWDEPWTLMDTSIAWDDVSSRDRRVESGESPQGA